MIRSPITLKLGLRKCRGIIAYVAIVIISPSAMLGSYSRGLRVTNVAD